MNATNNPPFLRREESMNMAHPRSLLRHDEGMNATNNQSFLRREESMNMAQPRSLLRHDEDMNTTNNKSFLRRSKSIANLRDHPSITSSKVLWVPKFWTTSLGGLTLTPTKWHQLPRNIHNISCTELISVVLLILLKSLIVEQSKLPRVFLIWIPPAYKYKRLSVLFRQVTCVLIYLYVLTLFILS